MEVETWGQHNSTSMSSEKRLSLDIISFRIAKRHCGQNLPACSMLDVHIRKHTTKWHLVEVDGEHVALGRFNQRYLELAKNIFGGSGQREQGLGAMQCYWWLNHGHLLCAISEWLWLYCFVCMCVDAVFVLFGDVLNVKVQSKYLSKGWSNCHFFEDVPVTVCVCVIYYLMSINTHNKK